MVNKEYNRGNNYAKQSLSKYSSFYKDEQGRIVGRKKGGSTEVMGKLSQHKSTKDDFYKGYYDELKLRASVLNKPKKKTLTYDPFGLNKKKGNNMWGF
jgi:hypothetical protein